jgi:hypothetical protein
MLRRLLESYLSEIEIAVAQLQNIQIDRYLEEALSPERLNLRIRIRFPNSNLLEISEAIQLITGNIVYLDYRYHYQNAENQLIFRYDNTPHFPDLPTFPHHKHLPNEVIAHPKPSLLQVLQEITHQP